MNKQHSNPTLAKDMIHAPEHMEASQEDLSDDQISADDEQSWSHHHTEPLHGLRFFPETPPGPRQSLSFFVLARGFVGVG